MMTGVFAPTPSSRYSTRKFSCRRNEKATYACLNYGEAMAPRQIADRSICIDGDIGEVLMELKQIGGSCD